MTPTQTLWIVVGIAGAAGLLAMLADSVRGLRWLVRVSGLAAVGAGAYWIWYGYTQAPQLVSGSFAVGQVFSGAAGLAVAAGGVAVLGSASGQPRQAQRSALVLFAAVGAAVAIASLDVVSLLIGLEIGAAAAYALVASSRGSAASESALKYFIQGAVATAIMLAGAAVVVGGFAPDGMYQQWAAALAEGVARPAVFAITALVAGLAFKAGAAPFHSWAPDAYQSAPPFAAGFLSSGAKVAAVTALATMVGSLGAVGASAVAPLGLLGSSLFPVLAVLAIASLLVGSLGALRQSSYTRLLGYAGIAQVGYALLALASLNPTVSVIYIVLYAVASLAAYMAAEAVQSARPGWDGSVAGLAGLGRSHPVLGVSVTVALLSMAGIPPLVGFWAKFQALQAAIAAVMTFAELGSTVLVTLWVVAVVIALAAAAVSIAYYGRVVRTLFQPHDDEEPYAFDGASRPAVATVVALAVLTVVLGLLPLFVPLVGLVSGFAY